VSETEEPQFDMSKMVEAIRESTEEQLEWLMQNRGEPDDEIKQTFVHTILQTRLLTKILDMLENINYKLAMANINIQDVEQEVAKLNPEYKS
jgi:hypothetical protein